MPGSGEPVGGNVKNLSIAARIITGFVLLLAALLVVGVITLIGLGKINSRVADVSAHELMFYKSTTELEVHMGNLRRFEKDYFLNIANADKRHEYMGKWKDTYDKAQATVKNLQDELAGDTDTLVSLKEPVSKQSGLLAAYAEGFNAVSGQIEGGALTSSADANNAFSKYKDNVHQMEDMLAKIAKTSNDAVNTLSDQINDTSNGVRTADLSILGAALLIGIVLSWWIVGSIRGPLNAMRDNSHELAETRNLTRQLPDFGNNELGSVGRSLDNLVGTVRQLIQESHQCSAQLVSAAEELSEVSEQVARASSMQSEAASSGAAAIEEMTVSINVVADNTQSVEEQARHTTAEANNSSQLAIEAAGEIRQIAGSIAETSRVIDQLNQRSGEIGDIVKVIRDIADQTNLLALNAAIEAARAGEMGRGFAVVADEVRKLAERTSQATAEISSRISGVQTDTRQAYQSMQEANSRIENGVSSAEQVAASLQRIRELSQSSMDKIADVADAIKEQSHASQDVARNVEQIAQMNESTNLSVQQSSELARQLQSLSAELDNSLNRFVV